MPRTSNSIYACVIRFLLSQKHIRQTRTDRTLQDGEEPSKNQVRYIIGNPCWYVPHKNLLSSFKDISSFNNTKSAQIWHKT